MAEKWDPPEGYENAVTKVILVYKDGDIAVCPMTGPVMIVGADRHAHPYDMTFQKACEEAIVLIKKRMGALWTFPERAWVDKVLRSGVPLGPPGVCMLPDCGCDGTPHDM